MTSELRSPITDAEWSAYHDIREQILWVARGRIGEYDRLHLDETREGNHPLVFFVNGKAIGVLRVDIAGEVAFFRRVAIQSGHQRLGHGRTMLALAEDFAREHGVRQIRSNVDRDAVEFYRKAGYQTVGPDLADGTTPMKKPLTP